MHECPPRVPPAFKRTGFRGVDYLQKSGIFHSERCGLRVRKGIVTERTYNLEQVRSLGIQLDANRLLDLAFVDRRQCNPPDKCLVILVHTGIIWLADRNTVRGQKVIISLQKTSSDFPIYRGQSACLTRVNKK